MDTDTRTFFFHINLLLGSKLLELPVYSLYLPLVFGFLGLFVLFCCFVFVLFCFLPDFLVFTTVFFLFLLMY